ncbi:TPA: hypothetical protein TVE87_001838, partial [Streptococcus equi subsp. zooepidemicus]|nr:hypothetical protein [Streptococcus equi subsp. zooepidemicus]
MAISDSSYKKLAEQVYYVETRKAKLDRKRVIDNTRKITDPKTGQIF